GGTEKPAQRLMLCMIAAIGTAVGLGAAYLRLREKPDPPPQPFQTISYAPYRDPRTGQWVNYSDYQAQPQAPFASKCEEAGVPPKTCACVERKVRSLRPTSEAEAIQATAGALERCTTAEDFRALFVGHCKKSDNPATECEC